MLSDKAHLSKPHTLSVIVLGDSIVIGEMDRGTAKVHHTPLKAPMLGYIPRVQKILPEIALHGIGFEGQSSLRILENIEKEIIQSEELRERFNRSDMIIFTGGLNDYWDFISPRAGALRIRASLVKLKTFASNAKIFAATLISPINKKHSEWIFQTNRLINSHSFKNLVVGPRFDGLQKEKLSSDGVHPNSAGYDQLAEILTTFICSKIATDLKEPSTQIIVPKKCSTLNP